MKLFNTIVSALALMAFAKAADPKVADSKVADPKEVPVQLDLFIDYELKEHPKVGAKDVATYTKGDTTTIKFTVMSRDQDGVTIIGAGGTVRDAATNQVVHNLTANAVQLIEIKKSSSYIFEHSFTVDFDPANYVLHPEVYVVVQEQVKSIPVRKQFLIVETDEVSVSDPQIVFLVVLFVVGIGGFGWFLYNSFLKHYLNGTAPTKKLSKKDRRASAVSTGKFNSEWIPEEHLKKTKRTKKAN